VDAIERLGYAYSVLSRLSVACAAVLLGLEAPVCLSCVEKRSSDLPSADAARMVAAAAFEPQPPKDAAPPATTSSATAKPVPKTATPKPFDAEEKKKRLSYVEALAKGRTATLARRYDDAIAAFDQAVAWDQNGRGYAERGYAYFLSKRYDMALKDFEAAASVPLSADLAGQVWFNRGLTYAALGRGAEADVAFFRSNRLRPTKAAENRVAGKKVCPLTIDRHRIDAQPYPGWRAWAAAVSAGAGITALGYVADATEAQAAARYCADCKGDGPWAVSFGAFEGTWPQVWDVHVIAKRDGKIWDYGVFGEGYMGPVTGEVCRGVDRVDVGAAGKYGTVVSQSAAMQRVPMKVSENGMSDCPDDSAWEDCRRWCMTSSSTESWFVLDLEHPARVLRVRQDNYYDRAEQPPPFDVKVTSGPDAFEAHGGACGSIPYAAPAP
jgi:tetratricopeptide (TPR) repeat protein